VFLGWLGGNSEFHEREFFAEVELALLNQGFDENEAAGYTLFIQEEWFTYFEGLSPDEAAEEFTLNVLPALLRQDADGGGVVTGGSELVG